MSGLAAFLTPDSITFTIDTLVTKNDSFPMVKQNNLSKFNFYPHLKCCVVALGYTQLGDDYYEFINSLVLSDIVDLVDLTQRYFLDVINVNDYPEDIIKNREDANHIGDLYVMGYSDKSSKMYSYKITVDRDSISVREMEMDIRKYIHPPIKEEIEDRIIDDAKKIEGAGIEHVLIEYMKQMAQDSTNEETFTVGVGMEIQLVNLIVINGNFLCSFSTAYRFDNFTEDLNKMSENQEADLIARTQKFKHKKNAYSKLEAENKKLMDLCGKLLELNESNHIKKLQSDNKELKQINLELLDMSKEMNARIQQLNKQNGIQV